MKILSTFPWDYTDRIGNLELHVHEQLAACDRDQLLTIFQSVRPDFVISDHLRVLQKLASFCSLNGIDHHVQFVQVVTAEATESAPEPNHEPNDHHPPIHRLQVSACKEKECLAWMEQLFLQQLSRPIRSVPAKSEADVVMIGAGIVNLITALELTEKGYQVHLYDAQPEPGDDSQWKQYGCTWAGQDARIFSLNESRHHHFKGDAMASVAQDQYRKTVADNGWLGCSPSSLSQQDKQWIKQYEQYPQWVFEKIHHDIIQFNKESEQGWQSLLRNNPGLFEQVGFMDRLFRIYESPQSWQKGQAEEKAIGAYKHAWEAADMPAELSALQPAAADESIVGVLEVKGFGIHIHKFARKLIQHLTERGVKFHWNQWARSIEFDQQGRVTGIQLEQERVEAACYVISPGVPRNDFLRGTSTYGQIGAMIGCWLTLPVPESDLSYPLKVSRSGYASDEAAAGANIIPYESESGEKMLHISSGHGYIGLDARNVDPARIEDLFKAVHETARKLFPESYERITSASGSLNPRYCIRPWTPSGNGIFEMIPTASSGMLVITGGHNTGGFAQSPAVARAVSSAFEGQSHPMHLLYHPERLTRLFRSELIPTGGGYV